MDQAQLAQITEAVRAAVKNARSIYDYLAICLPPLTVAIGWFVSFWWQGRQFSKSNEKEQYYHVRGKTEEIVNSFNQFLDEIYRFYKSAKNRLNPPDFNLLSQDEIDDFITEIEFKLARIHQVQRLMFPGRTFNTKSIMDPLNELIEGIRSMNGCRGRLRELSAMPKDEGQKLFDQLNQEAGDLNSKNAAATKQITKAVGAIEDQMIGLNTEKARVLRIR